MMNICILHKGNMSIVNMVNVTNIAYNATTGAVTIHGAYATNPTNIIDLTINSSDYLVRIMEN